MEQQRSLPAPYVAVAIGPIVLALIVFLILRSRRKSRADRAFDRIHQVIDDSDLPIRAKEMLNDAVEQARDAMTTLRARASDLTG